MQGVPLLEKVYRFRGISFFVFLVFDSLLSWLLGFKVSKLQRLKCSILPHVRSMFVGGN